MTVTAGTGGAASAGTGNGGAAGNVILQAGTGGTSAGGTAGVDGMVASRGIVTAKKISAPAALTTTTAITAAQVVGGLITANQGGAGAATYTFPTGTQLAAALPAAFTTGDSFYFHAVNISTNAAEDVTFAGDTGTTMVGNVTMAANSGVTELSWATFLIRMTGANAFSLYRVG